MFVCERERRRESESGGVSTRESCGEDEKATQPPRLLLWKTFLVCFSIYS